MENESSASERLSTRITAPAGDPSTQLRGVLYMLGAVCAFACMDVTMKRLGEAYPTNQVTLLRGLSALPFFLGVGAAFGRLSAFRPRRWSLHLLRGVLSYVTLFSLIWAVGRLSLVHCYAIFMSAPLMIVALAGPVLGERVSLRRWAAVGLGMIGVLVALQPSASGFSLVGGLAALAAALGYALTALSVRIMVRTETGAATAFWGLLFPSLFSGMLLLGNWTPMRMEDLPWVLALGLTGSLGQHLITQAFQLAPAPLLAPLEYTDCCGASVSTSYSGTSRRNHTCCSARAL